MKKKGLNRAFRPQGKSASQINGELTLEDFKALCFKEGVAHPFESAYFLAYYGDIKLRNDHGNVLLLRNVNTSEEVKIRRSYQKASFPEYSNLSSVFSLNQKGSEHCLPPLGFLFQDSLQPLNSLCLRKLRN